MVKTLTALASDPGFITSTASWQQTAALTQVSGDPVPLLASGTRHPCSTVHLHAGKKHLNIFLQKSFTYIFIKPLFPQL